MTARSITYLRFSASLAAGGSIAASCAGPFLSAWMPSPAWELPVFLTLTFFFGLIVYGLLFRLVLHRLASFSDRAKILWALTSLFAGWMMILVIPIDVTAVYLPAPAQEEHGTAPTLIVVGRYAAVVVSLGTLVFVTSVW